MTEKSAIYVGIHDAVYIPALDGREVERGKAITGPAAVIDSLLEQSDNWAPAPADEQLTTEDEVERPPRRVPPRQ